jgi:hypothetical protein
MTRIERVAEYLESMGRPPLAARARAAELLAIADEGRRYVTLLEIAQLVGRGHETVRSWADRGTWDFPAHTGTIHSAGRGPSRFWDAEVITAWIAEHPGLQGRQG